jgi:hypothetical protein
MWKSERKKIAEKFTEDGYKPEIFIVASMTKTHSVDLK